MDKIRERQRAIVDKIFPTYEESRRSEGADRPIQRHYAIC